MSHFFFFKSIHLLRLFLCLAIVNNAAMNMGIQLFFKLVFSFSLDITAGTLIFLRKTSDHGVEGLTSSPTSVILDLGLAVMVSLTLATVVLGSPEGVGLLLHCVHSICYQ